MYKIDCKICGKSFESEYNGPEKSNLSKHVKNYHNINKEDYLIKYYYDGAQPKCACGCGKDVRCYKFSFLKYISDHKNYVPMSDEQKLRWLKTKKENLTIEKKLQSKGLSEDILKYYFERFKNIEISLLDIQRDLKVDKRTITSYWYELNITTPQEFINISKRSKYIGIRKSAFDRKITEDEIIEIMLLFEESKEKITLDQIKCKLNLKYSIRTIYNTIKNKFGKDLLNKYLKLGGTSNLESDFYFVLRFYFGNRIRSKFVIENKIYDYILDNKYLIELDGDYWHSSDLAKENDIYKNNLAIKFGYNIIRIKESEVKNIDILKKINEII